MRVLALDLGSRRIGVALSDPSGTLASPVATITRARQRVDDHRRIAELVAEHQAERVVVGLPLSLDGSVGPAARGVLAEVDELAGTLAVPVETFDERFTTVTADGYLREAGRRGRQRVGVVDQAAAAVLLQAWLDGPGRVRHPDEEHEER
ncbi:MAG: Holliday junction resolvase RuvX [Acidimicrobiales bacterium]